MPLYTGCDCPICGKPFEEKDDVVVCPVCGSPHHRECYKAVGHCGNDDYHKVNRQWEAPVTAAPQTAEEVQDLRVCRSCGANNPAGNCFCQACGQRLGGEAPQNGPDPYQQNRGMGMGMGGMGMGPAAWNNCQGQPDLAQVLDEGVTVKDACDYVGPNAISFIMRFKGVITGAMTFNWSAFFFGFYYCFYRKMYKLGAALLGIFLLTLIPSGYFSAIALKEILAASGGALTFPLDFVLDGVGYRGMAMVGAVTRLVNLMTMLFCGFFFNKVYYRNMLGAVRRVREKGHCSVGTPEYSSAVRRVGGVNKSAVLMTIAGLFVVYMIFGYVASFFVLA